MNSMTCAKTVPAGHPPFNMPYKGSRPRNLPPGVTATRMEGKPGFWSLAVGNPPPPQRPARFTPPEPARKRARVAPCSPLVVALVSGQDARGELEANSNGEAEELIAALQAATGAVDIKVTTSIFFDTDELELCGFTVTKADGIFFGEVIFRITRDF